MKKFLSIFITVIMSLTMFSSVTSLADNSVQAPQSYLQKGVNYPSVVPNWFVISTVTTAKNIIKDKELLKKCTLKFFENHKIYGICFSVKGSNSTVTYTGDFRYNIDVPANSDTETEINYIDFIVVKSSEGYPNDIGIVLNYKFNNADGSYNSQTTCLYPTQIYVFSPDPKPDLKKVTKVKVKSPKKKTIKISWNKIKDVTGYIVELSTSKKFKTKKLQIHTIKKNKNKITLKKLKRKKKYYVKVRAYKSIILNGKRVNVYSKEWSKIKTIKTK